jgi:hypothetical protein
MWSIVAKAAICRQRWELAPWQSDLLPKLLLPWNSREMDEEHAYLGLIHSMKMMRFRKWKRNKTSSQSEK